MVFAGFVKNTLLDYPGRVASTVFTGGCDLRCIFCHNPHLVWDVGQAAAATGLTSGETAPGEMTSGETAPGTASGAVAASATASAITEEEVLSFMKSRRGLIDALCISGGEPLLHEGLIPFLTRARDVVKYIKIDTNGMHPDVLKEISNKSLADYVAMDIKTDRERYPEICGFKMIPKPRPLVSPRVSHLDESIELLKSGAFPAYEFRTTVIAEYYDEETAESVGRWLEGAERYVLQSFEDGDMIPAGKGVLHARSLEETERYAEILRKYVKEVVLRGQG